MHKTKRTQHDVARVQLGEGDVEGPDGAKRGQLEAAEDREADHARADRVGGHLVELQPRAVQHLQAEQRAWSGSGAGA
jgi:hypothetical protein